MSTTEQEWRCELPDTEELCRKLLFAIEEAAEAQDYNRLAEIEDRLKNVKYAHDQARASWEEETSRVMQERGDKKFQIGDIEYRHRRDKRVKCRSNTATLDAVLESLEGDTDKAAGLLASNPWKASSVKSIVGEDRWGELFSVEYADKVQLKAVDTSQLPKKPKGATDDDG